MSCMPTQNYQIMKYGLKQHLIEFLKTHTNLEIVDRGRWFYAIYHSKVGRRNIAFRADFDALPIEETINLPYGSECPGVSHKCGHDGHAATLCGFALEIDQNGSDNNVFFLFQHAEETGDGAARVFCFDQGKPNRRNLWLA